MNTKKSNPLSLLLKWAGKDKNYLYLSIILSFISGLSMVFPYLGVYHIMNAVFAGTCTKEVIANNCLFIVAGVVIRSAFFGISGVASHKGAYNALFTVRCMVTEHMSKIPLGTLSERTTGDIKSVLNEQIEKLELFLAHQLPELIYYLSGPIAIFIYLLTVNVPLAFVSVVPIIAGSFIMSIIFKKMASMMGRATTASVNLNSVMIEYISGMRLIKAYNMGSKSFQKYTNAIKEENDVWNDMSMKMGPPFAVFVIVIECGMLLIVPLGGWMLLNNHLSVGAYLLFSFVGSLYLTEIKPLQELGANFAQVLTAITNSDELLNIQPFAGGSEFPSHHDIELKNVEFSYDGKTTVLTNCSLHVNAGEKIALVGPSGAGKSTLIQLISRFYDVKIGAVLIGEKNVKDINYETLLENVAVVFQRTFLTRDTVLENIRMGNNASMDEVRRAARDAQIDDFIMTLPDGYNTKVGSFGSRFSGGEKQRIAIARAILKNAPILILDEATSAADPENQVEIDKAIQNLCTGKTVIIIAHRLGVIKMCDKVAVVENHTITCSGTHEEVRRTNKYYNDAWLDYEKARNITYHFSGGKDNEME